MLYSIQFLHQITTYAALEVGRLVLVNDIHLGELVEHGGHFRKQYQSGLLLGRVAQRLHGVTSRLVVIFVPNLPHLGLAYSLLR